MLATLDFTGLEHWAPFNFPQSTALIVFFFIIITRLNKKKTITYGQHLTVGRFGSTTSNEIG